MIVHLNERDKLPRPKIAEILSSMEVQAAAQIARYPDPEAVRYQLSQMEANLDAVKKRQKPKSRLREHLDRSPRRDAQEAGDRHRLVESR
jgi:hypothetical protein